MANSWTWASRCFLTSEQFWLYKSSGEKNVKIFPEQNEQTEEIENCFHAMSSFGENECCELLEKRKWESSSIGGLLVWFARDSR